jgi:hypothetical protein
MSAARSAQEAIQADAARREAKANRRAAAVCEHQDPRQKKLSEMLARVPLRVHSQDMETTTTNLTSSNQSDVAVEQCQTDQKTQNRYFIEYPRNFGNECTVYVASTPGTVQWCEAKVESALGECSSTFERITRKEALRVCKGISYLGVLYFDERSDAWHEMACGSFTPDEWFKASARSFNKMAWREANSND